MNLQEQISRIKGIMGLKEEIHPKAFLKKYDPKNNEDFSNSVVKQIVWRTGPIDLNPFHRDYYGLWFAENKEDAENFARIVRKNPLPADPYYINLQNPKYYDRFNVCVGRTDDNSYRTHLESVGQDRNRLFNILLENRYDGMIIGEDDWIDDGEGKQFVVFNPKNVKPA